MANTSSRTLRLLSLLQTHRYWPGLELAERLAKSIESSRPSLQHQNDFPLIGDLTLPAIKGSRAGK